MQVTDLTQEQIGRLRSRGRPAKLPLAIRAVIFGMVAAFFADNLFAFVFGTTSLFGYNTTSLGWLIPLLFCALVLVKRGFRRIRFPHWIWVPWSLWMLLYLLLSDYPNALQRSVMLLTPVVVGMAVSTIRVDAFVLSRSSRWLERFFWVFMIAVGMTTGLLTTGQLDERTGFAAGSITASLLAAWYAGRYITFSNRFDLYRWAVLATVPVLANTRTGMVAVAITLPLTLVPWPLAKRLIVVGILAGLGLLVFQMDRIQSKMFFSGEGTLQDAIEGVIGLVTGGPISADFATSGRMALAQALKLGLHGHYWFGLGANASEAVTRTFGGMTHPHNDWLRVQYDYGTLGMMLFALTMAGTALHAYLRARRLPPETALYLFVGASAFLPMAIFMFFDNVILYAAWFGNLHFALLGLGYAATSALPLVKKKASSEVRWG